MASLLIGNDLAVKASLQRTHPPGHDNGAGGEAALENFVPTDEPAATGAQELVDAPHEPGLQRILVLQVCLPQPPLARLACAPPHLGALHPAATGSAANRRSFQMQLK